MITIAHLVRLRLSGELKRCQIFEWLKNNKYDICFLQELHCQDIFNDKWRQEWGNHAFFCGNSSNSTGIGILFSPNVRF